MIENGASNMKAAASVASPSSAELSFEGQGLKLNNANDAKDVVAKIKATKNITTLTFSGNTVGIDAAQVIGQALEEHSELKYAHWKDIFTTREKTEIPPALKHLSRGLMTANVRLVELDLSDNAFGPIGMEGIVDLLKSPSCFTLQELKLNNTGCGVTGGKLLAKTLMECYKLSGGKLALRKFILGRSRQENAGATALAEVFKAMGSLEEVVMPQNGIYFEGLTALADAFSNNPNLRILNMNDNTFTVKGAKAMASALRKLNNLEILNLGDCLLKSGGTKLICRALTGRHPNLTELVLDSNEIRLKGGLEIVKAVEDKTNLQKLSFDANQFGASGLKQILQKLSDIGKRDIIGETDDNEEPDSDEEDPDVSDEEETEPETAKPQSSSTSIFGGSPKPGASIFGGTSSSSSIFGGQANNTSFKPAGNLFTAAPPQGASVFGSSTPSASIFSKPADSSTAEKPQSTSNIFAPLSGEAASSSKPTFAFGTGAPPSSSICGGSATSSSSLFGGAAAAVKTEEAPSQPDSSTGSIFGSGNKSTVAFDFKSLATDGKGFSTASEDFRFAGAGSSLFGKKASAKGDDEEG